jgi:hypothetical protein
MKTNSRFEFKRVYDESAEDLGANKVETITVSFQMIKIIFLMNSIIKKSVFRRKPKRKKMLSSLAT